jgi:4-aminobutyrate aminotransferase-like enzyme
VVGLTIGLDIGKPEYARKVREKCLKDGLLFTTQGETLVFFPPLTIDSRVATEAIDILEANL